jgi:hypothetical protein
MGRAWDSTPIFLKNIQVGRDELHRQQTSIGAYGICEIKSTIAPTAAAIDNRLPYLRFNGRVRPLITVLLANESTLHNKWYSIESYGNTQGKGTPPMADPSTPADERSTLD